MDKILRVTEIVLLNLAFWTFGCSWVMSFWLWKTMPTQPEISQDFTIPMIIHGTTIYLSHFYDTVYKSLFWGSFVMFLSGTLIDFYKDPFHRQRR